MDGETVKFTSAQQEKKPMYIFFLRQFSFRKKFSDRRADRCDEANSRLSKLFAKVPKRQYFMQRNLVHFFMFTKRVGRFVFQVYAFFIGLPCI
jgi:hypothetical protein